MGVERVSPGSGKVPPFYWWWLSAITVSLLGSQIQSFALGWTATAHGASLAALVLTVGSIPGFMLMLVGGAVADSRGPWLVMVISDGAMCAATAVLLVAVIFLGTPAWLLLVAAIMVGTSNAFYMPSSGTIPRRLVDGAALGKAMAARQMAGQTVSVLGASLGGLVVAIAGLGGAAALNSVSFAVILVLLVGARRRFLAQQPRRSQPGLLLKRALGGLGVAGRDRLLRSLLMLVAAVAMCLLPVTTLMIPLLVRAHAWSVLTAGQMVGGQALAGGVVVVCVLVRGTSRRPGTALSIGVLTASLSTGALAVIGSPVLASAACALTGAGLGIFGTHVAPLMLAATPEPYLSRVQAVLTLCQTLPMVLGLSLDGFLVGRVGVRGALLVTGRDRVLCRCPGNGQQGHAQGFSHLPARRWLVPCSVRCLHCRYASGSG
jgi:MFS family permease